jgi:hypothetical protein
MFDQLFIEKSRKAVFRVYSEKYKELIKKSEIDEAVMSGEYRVLPTDPNVYQVFLSS